ncbi:hypothetical protein ACJJTC_008241 [Scirpophaga incertulas]
MRKTEEERDGERERARRFEVGDLVWGPVKGFASWPGKLEEQEGGRWRVRWFGGDRGAASVNATRLLTLTEGLEAHHAARTRHRKSRKLNTLLENAIQEAMAELDKKSEATSDSQIQSSNEETTDCDLIIETPKRNRKNDKIKPKERTRKKATKVSKTGDSTRLRSSR